VGKTTLFKSILGFLPLKKGEVLIDGKSFKKFSRSELARMISYVPQAHETQFAFTVLETVLMGRSVYFGTFGSPKKEDKAAAEKALEDLGISFLSDRKYSQLSGGERQMVLIARALAQSPNFIMMDEPTSNLDYGNQVRVLQCVKKLAEQGIGIIMTTHSPDHVFQCGGKVAFLQRNNLYLYGVPEQILTRENLSKGYGVSVYITQNIIEDREISSCIPVLHS
jgi:iron complex transport system ATP-binding protein